MPTRRNLFSEATELLQRTVPTTSSIDSRSSEQLMQSFDWNVHVQAGCDSTGIGSQVPDCHTDPAAHLPAAGSRAASGRGRHSGPQMQRPAAGLPSSADVSACE